ncbi:hypothetical protein FRX31_010940 [Thalictrum thalictroides]|uniref:F-box associated beta-propeller type 3 domain-containing protein n=1 Tax=Thalictrum thalictroides TaxID=46969 RepID=A0A7J6WQ35_THATH|nr:hypothetical protein FRX31_010940 [Thalictrum thalictroides]
MAVSLPDDIIFSDILILVSAKNLLRFKCVCKFWCKSISDPCFVKDHLNKQRSLLPGIIKLDEFSPPPEKPTYHIRKCDTLFFFDFDYITKESFSINLKKIITNRNYFRLMASCDGLLVIQIIDCSPKCYYLINPATSSYTQLPSPPQCFSNCRLLYDSSLDDYNVVGWNSGETFFVLSVGDSNNTEPSCWRVFLLPVDDQTPISGVIVVKGQLLWLIRNGNHSIIRSLNITNGEVGEIMLPEYKIEWKLRIIEMKGCLYLANFPEWDEHCFIVWILEDWDEKLWAKLYQKWHKKRCENGSCMCSGSDFSIFDYIEDKHFQRVYYKVTDNENWIPHFSSLVDVKQLTGARKSGSTSELSRNNYLTFSIFNYLYSLLSLDK